MKINPFEEKSVEEKKHDLVKKIQSAYANIQKWAGMYDGLTHTDFSKMTSWEDAELWLDMYMTIFDGAAFFRDTLDVFAVAWNQLESETLIQSAANTILAKNFESIFANCVMIMKMHRPEPMQSEMKNLYARYKQSIKSKKLLWSKKLQSETPQNS